MTNTDVVVCTPYPAMAHALVRLGVITPATPVLDQPTPEDVAEKLVVGWVPPHLALAAKAVREPKWDLTVADRERAGSDPLCAGEWLARYRGFEDWEVLPVEDDQSKATLILTRHEGLVRWVRAERLAAPDAPEMDHAEPDDLEDHVVVGVMPLWLAAAAVHAIGIELHLPRGLTGQDLTVEQMRPHVKGVTRYRVVRPRTG